MSRFEQEARDLLAADPRLKVEVLAKTPNPQQVIYRGLHQCFSEESVAYSPAPSESKAGEIAVRRLLRNGIGHWSPCEHVAITFNVIGYPHSAIQQATRHRIASFSVQSMRYTGDRLIKAANGWTGVTDVVYVRPEGRYRDRSGKDYAYTTEQRKDDIALAALCVRRYRDRVQDGFSEEQSRELIPCGVRQDMVVTFNLRSACHFMAMRYKADAQVEIRAMAMQMWDHIKAWVPEIADYYEQQELGKARLAP